MSLWTSVREDRSIVSEIRRTAISRIGLMICALAMAAMSGAETMYILSFHNHTLWLIQPSFVGGWGHVILNFVILSIALAAQAMLVWYIWMRSFIDSTETKIKPAADDDEDDEDNEETPSWLFMAGFAPVGVGIALTILWWVDFFVDCTLTYTPFLVVFGVIAVVAVCGMVYQFYRLRFVRGVVFPALFIVQSVGLAITIMILSLIVIIVGIVGAIFIGITLMVLATVGGVLFGKSPVTGKTPDGRIIKGYKDRNGVIHGDDGNKYIID